MTSTNIVVSFIIPFFNAEKYIEDSAKSCIEQINISEKSSEIILINDGSTDNSLKKIKPFLDNFKNIQIVNLNYNKGPAYARNRGLELAKGEYISFVDADDILRPNKTDIQLKILKANNNVGLIISAIREIDDRGNFLRNRIRKLPTDKKEQVIAFFLEELTSYTPTMLFRSSILKEVGLMNENLRHLEDKDFVLRILLKYDILYLKEPLVIRRVLVQGTSLGVSEKEYLQTRQKSLELAIQYYPYLKKYTNKYLSKIYYNLGRVLALRNNTVRARYYYLMSLKRMINKRTVFSYLVSFLPYFIQEFSTKILSKYAKKGF